MNCFRPRLFLLLAALCTCAEGNALKGEGYGPTVKEARIEAMEALASSIFVRIESSSQNYRDSEGTDLFSSSVQSSSDLPLFGLQSECQALPSQHFCVVTMNVERVIPLYRQKLNELRASIDSRHEQLAKLADSEQYLQLEKVVADYVQFNKYLMVLSYLNGANNDIAMPVARLFTIKDKLAALEANAGTLELAAKLLARNIDVRPIYISPPALQGSREITPFATAVSQALKQVLDSTEDRAKAEYVYQGLYQQHGKGIRLSYQLVDNSGNTLRAKVIELAPSSYARFRTEALAPDFDTLLHKGYAVTSNFNAHINTNKGGRNLAFGEGETVRLVVKLNKAGYFYIAGHSKNKEMELSYLLDLNDAGTDRRFVFYINADDSNKWVSIGEFEVAPPFGLESLQLIASEADLIDSLPSYRYDSASGYYVISRKIESGVEKTRKTRGLKKKNAQSAQTSETVLLFTTHEAALNAP